MGLSDSLPGAGLVGGGAGVLGDVLLNGGEIIISLVGFLITTPDAWLTIVLYGERLAGMVAWLPSEPLQMLVVAGLVLTIAIGLARLVSRWRESR